MKQTLIIVINKNNNYNINNNINNDNDKKTINAVTHYVINEAYVLRRWKLFMY